jgi:flagellar basal-body rod modification protein FlgD
MPINTVTNAAKTPLPINNKSVSQQTNTTKTETPKTDADKASSDYNDFLTLLTAQLKNQDPLQPLDSSTFVSQLAQFSNVEQQVKMNQKLDGLVASLTGNDFSKASNFLGKYVSATGGKTYITPDDTQTSFSYKTGETAKSVTATITDRFGKEVRNIQMPLAPNGISQNWDLTDTQGKKVEQGLYNITIKSTDDQGVITKTPAETKVKILQAEKTDAGFEYLTNTKEKITNDAIKKVYAE